MGACRHVCCGHGAFGCEGLWVAGVGAPTVPRPGSAVDDDAAVIAIRVKFIFPAELVPEPIVATLVRDFAVVPNVRRAAVEAESGWMVLEVSGEAADIDRALAWASARGVDVELLGDVVGS